MSKTMQLYPGLSHAAIEALEAILAQQTSCGMKMTVNVSSIFER